MTSKAYLSLSGVKYVITSGLTDAYGNTSDGVVMYVTYSNETLAKVNFDNFDVSNVVAISDDYFRNPQLK